MSYAYWQKALAGENPPVHDGDPQCGFFYKKDKERGRLPVAIWNVSGGAMICLVNGKPADPVDIWTWVAGNPITEQLYHEVVETGQWPDDPQLGHNMPDEKAEIEDQIDNAMVRASEFEKIETQEDADLAANTRKRLNDLAKLAEEKRKELKQPHVDAGRAVDEVWKPIVSKAKDEADRLRGLLKPFMKEHGGKAGGLLGKKAGLTTRKSAKITSYGELHEELCANDEYVREWYKLMQRHANGLARKGFTLKGMVIVETTEVQ